MNGFIDWLYSSSFHIFGTVFGAVFGLLIAELVLHEFACFGYHFLIYCKIL